MEKNQKIIKSSITIILSVLFSILVVFSVANGVSYIRHDALQVEGSGVIRGPLTADSVVVGNITPAPTSSLLVVGGNVGLGPKFQKSIPAYPLDVQGIVNASGFFKAGQPIVYKANCLGDVKSRSSNKEVIDQWCGQSHPALNDNCVPFLVSFNQNDNDPDAIRNIACGIANNRLFIHTDTTGGDDELIGYGSVCGAICLGYVDVSGSPQPHGTGGDCPTNDPNQPTEC
jgi:hypothetical protein